MISETILAANSACGSMHPRVPELLTTVNTGNNITLTVTELKRHSARGAMFQVTDLRELPPIMEVRCGARAVGGTGIGATCGRPLPVSAAAAIRDGVRLVLGCGLSVLRGRLSLSRLSAGGSSAVVIADSCGAELTKIAPSLGVPT